MSALSENLTILERMAIETLAMQLHQQSGLNGVWRDLARAKRDEFRAEAHTIALGAEPSHWPQT